MVAEEAAHWLQVADCRTVITLDLLAPAVAPSLKKGPLEQVILTSLARRMAMWRGMLYRVERLRRNGFRFMFDDGRHPRFEQLLQAEPLDSSVEIDPAKDVAVLAPTGGTTASPKAVMLTHRNLVANALQLRHWLGGPDGVGSILGVLPLFHSYGFTVEVLVSWARGCTVHLHPRFESRAVLDLILARQPELVPAVPAVINALNHVMRGRKYDLSFIRTVISGASALDPKVRAEFESYGVNDLVEGYGLTEASPVTHTNPPGAGNRPGTIGLPLADTEALLVDSDIGAPVGPGEVGEIVVRGPQVMKGYYKNPEATAAVLRDGWLQTGDMATCDGDGYFTIVDRKKDIIKTSGFLVYPAEVEEMLRSFPGVAEAAVIGVPDPERGEAVKALIVPQDGVFDQRALEAFCHEHLSKHKRPRQVEVVRELPKNFLGKVMRRKLRERQTA
jgi:long-chain acyl-CoA synthetase